MMNASSESEIVRVFAQSNSEHLSAAMNPGSDCSDWCVHQLSDFFVAVSLDITKNDRRLIIRWDCCQLAGDLITK